jgi:hypothetical protein
MPPPNFPNEPPSEPPYLNPTASWYAGDAWYLFAIVIAKCGYPTAKFIFEKCIKEGAEIEAAKEKRTAAAQRRATAAPMKIPTIKEIDSADRERVCIWYTRWLETEQHLSAQEQKAVAHLTKRYIQFGGFPADFVPRLPPIKRKGARTRNAPGAELPAMFDKTNPQSSFSIEKAKRNGRFGKEQFAELLASRPDKKYGPTAEAVLRNERNWRKKKQKV